MTQVRKSMLWLATIGAAFGVAFVVAFLQSRKPDGQLLFDATVAASFSAAALFASVLLVCVDSLRRLPLTAPFVNLPKPAKVACASIPAVATQSRQEILQKRLDIDEPRLCTYAELPCTCWSLCGPGPEKNPSVIADESRGAGACADLPSIHRGRVPGCHLASLADGKNTAL